MLLAKGKITQDMISLSDKWRHTGFNVFFWVDLQTQSKPDVFHTYLQNFYPVKT